MWYVMVFDAITGALHRLRRGDELIERLAPALAEAHAVMGVAALLVLMHGERGVFRSFSVRLHHDDRGEGRNIEGRIGRPEAGRKRHRPNELAVRHDLEEAADVGYVFAFRRAHHRAEDAAGTKVDFAIDRFPRRRHEPFLDMRGHGPRRPYELGRDVDHALQNEIKTRIVLDGSGHLVSSLSSVKYLSSRASRPSHSARSWAIQRSAAFSGRGTSRYVRTRPPLRERTRPHCSSTSRCCVKEGSAMSKARASSLTGAGPALSRLSTARRVGSPSARKTRSRCICWLGICLTISQADT